MPAQIPEPIWSLIYFLPLVSNLIILVERIFPAGSENMFFNSDLSSSDKQMEFVFEEYEFYIRINGLITWKVFFSSPLILFNVIGLYGKHTLMVSTGSSYVVDGVIVYSCQALDSRHSHWGQKSPVILLRIIAEKKFPWKERAKIKHNLCFISKTTILQQLSFQVCSSTDRNGLTIFKSLDPKAKKTYHHFLLSSKCITKILKAWLKTTSFYSSWSRGDLKHIWNTMFYIFPSYPLLLLDHASKSGTKHFKYLKYLFFSLTSSQHVIYRLWSLRIQCLKVVGSEQIIVSCTTQWFWSYLYQVAGLHI